MNRLIVLIGLAALLSACTQSPEISKPSLDKASGSAVAETPSAQTAQTIQLTARNAEFTQEIITLTDRVYTAVGYSVSPMTMIVGDDGYIIVDTGIHPDHAAQAREAFEAITDKPLTAIIYTHGHGDHTSGASAFLTPNQTVDIYAASNYGEEAARNTDSGITIAGHRGFRQAGFGIQERRINNGIAKAVWLDRQVFDANTVALTAPTHLISEPQIITIAGVDVEFMLNPGETDDHLMIWLPSEKLVFAGDNFYKSWPNLYAIRGTKYRDVLEWQRSIDRIRERKANILVGGHTRPIIGAKLVDDVLSDYSEGIKFVFDKTIEGINLGLTPDELVDYVVLPDRLAEKDYLQPYYGHPEWAVRSIFDGYLGWFDGNPTSLFPLSPQDEAQNFIRLAGGAAIVRGDAKVALPTNPQWSAQLADRLLAIDPEDKDAMLIKAKALETLGENLLTATGRNYYFTVAQELRVAGK